jgi:rhamnulokinase
MPASANLVALDLGAESGRAILATIADGRLELKPMHRFPNGPIRVRDSVHWDVLRLFAEIKAGLAMCRAECDGEIVSLGVDTWGVDFALLDKRGDLLANPYHYRDKRTEGMIDEACRRVPRREIFGYTGIQFMPLNTLFQLLSMGLANSPLLDIADRLLTMPDLLNFWLTGQAACEFSNATTTQLYNPRENDWARELLQRLGLPTHFLVDVVPSGTRLGGLLPSVAEEVGLPSATVVAPACHDTGSAVAGVPAEGNDHVYLSSGTWSLMGFESERPIITDEALEANFTNEGAADGGIRFLKNIMGLWLVQECRRAWERRGEPMGYDELSALAAAAPAFGPIVEPDAAAFLAPRDMPEALRTFCRETGQAVPADKGALLRCALESLALKYRWTVERLSAIRGKRLSPIHIVGGGCQNALLCQLAADATGLPVVAGPVEATAIGNALVQALAMGIIGSIGEGREMVRRSFDVVTYEPDAAARGAWDDAYGRYLDIMAKADKAL